MTVWVRVGKYLDNLVPQCSQMCKCVRGGAKEKEKVCACVGGENDRAQFIGRVRKWRHEQAFNESK